MNQLLKVEQIQTGLASHDSLGFIARESLSIYVEAPIFPMRVASKRSS
jgi:hypothetical protein